MVVSTLTPALKTANGHLRKRLAVRCASLPPFPENAKKKTWRSRLCGAGLKLGAGLTLGLVGALLPSGAWGAERVILQFGVLGDSVAVADLVRYVETGKAKGSLADYVRFLKPEQREQFRAAFSTRADLSVVAVDRFLYSPQGEVLLDRLGEVIRLSSNQNGFFGLRAAMILAAADANEGLTLLNVVRKFPTSGVRIDLEKTLGFAQELNTLVKQTQRSSRQLQEDALAQPQPVLPQPIADLQQLGPYGVEVRSLSLTDASRSRTFPVDLHLPQRRSDQSPLPVVVISHGLGSGRNTFMYLAKHLASHGFAVAVPEHPGSNEAQIEKLLRGLVKEVAEPTEFLDRPKDISFLLNELARTDLAPVQLNLQNVGVIGQSFGGYTALALGGAEIEARSLQRSCRNLDTTWNLSLLLQCRALAVINQNLSLRDPRVSAVLAINPIASALFGQDGMAKTQLPTMIVAGEEDTVAPAVMEQIKPFESLKQQSRYLVLMQGGTHFSVLEDSATNPFPVPSQVMGADVAIARRHTSALSLAMMRAHVLGAKADEAYLSQAYVQTLPVGTRVRSFLLKR